MKKIIAEDSSGCRFYLETDGKQYRIFGKGVNITCDSIPRGMEQLKAMYREQGRILTTYTLSKDVVVS